MESEKRRIGKEIASLRAKRGMTIRELSAISGVHNSNIARIENGKLSAGIDTLSKIAHALGVKITFIETK